MAAPPTRGTPNATSGGESVDRLSPVLLAAVALAVLFVAIVLVAVTTLTGAETAASAEKEKASATKGPAHYTVRSGDSYGSIAQKIGVAVADLEKYNPYVNPATIRPGQRLKLRATKAKPKKRGPIFHKVRQGDTLGSIAFRWDRSVPRLKQLNPKLEDTALKPGTNVRLRK